MKTSIAQFSGNSWSQHAVSQLVDNQKANLVLCFAGKDVLSKANIYQTIRDRFPQSDIALCSTAGEIYQDTVQDDSLVAVAMEFSDTRVRTACVDIRDFETSFDAARQLTSELMDQDLTYIMVLSDGSMVNGSELVKGFNTGNRNILVTGGLAGDADRFKSTLVGLNEQPSEGKIIAIGFYGQKLIVTHGSQGGWDMFGLEKEITKSDSNVLYEINNESALNMYKKYLGPDVDNLPGSALLFPLSVTMPGVEKPIVRTILSIDEADNSMTFAGDVPVGSRVRFMKANFDKLTAAAATAAQQTIFERDDKPDFALLVSCVGRKLILGPRSDEEVEAVSETFGGSVPLAGFYAYGEISPFNEGGSCQLHNQTMTITSFYELP